MNGVVAWLVKPCNPEEPNVSERYSPSILYFHFAAFFIGFLDPEDVRDVFLGNVGFFLNYTKLQPRRRYCFVMLYF